MILRRTKTTAPGSVTTDGLAQEIVTTLRDMIGVSLPQPESLLSRKKFWSRCQLVTPNWTNFAITSRIYVDGFVGACCWNSWKVYNSGIEEGLSLWLGFAHRWGRWTEHAWCMLDQRIVETTAPYLAYYGAELDEQEREYFSKYISVSNPALQKIVRVATMIEGHRTHVTYDPAIYADTIGRERDPVTREIKEGLGR